MFSCKLCWMGAIMILVCGNRAVAEEDAVGQTPRIRFVKTQLDSEFRSEGVTVADFNRDGKLDIAAGYQWYAAPDWEMHLILEEPQAYDPSGYANSFINESDDLNGDGWPDLIIVDFPGRPTSWFENPGEGDGPWQRHTCVAVSNNESPQMVDIDGDGRREWLMAYSPDPVHVDGPQRRMAYFTPAEDPEALWEAHPLSEAAAPGTRRYSHGLGSGDVNSDGLCDVLCAEGWWEAPEGYGTDKPWSFHAVDFGGRAAHMHVYDFDDDGDSDVLTSSPHSFGIWWHEQRDNGSWQRHLIDDSFSQTHSLCVADINSDGLPDFITGKRWWAHGGRDPGGDEPAVLFWYELTRDATTGQPRWTPHQFDHDSGVGTQFVVTDVNGDGLIDVVTSNKKGVYYFEQVRE